MSKTAVDRIDHPPVDLRAAAWFMVLAALAFALMSAAVKVASRDVPTTMVVFFRNVVALVWLAPWAWQQGARGLATRQFPGHLVRALAGLASMASFFFAIGHMRLADAVLLNQSFPLFLPMAESIWTRDPIPGSVWGSLLLGFLGIVLILKPGSELFSVVALIGVASAVLAAVAQVGIRRLTRTDPVPRIVFYFALIAASITALALPFAWRMPTWPTIIALVSTGTFATIGQLAVTRGYAHAPAALVGPFIYTGVVFAALLDWILWRSLPDPLFVPGALLVAAAGARMLKHHQATTGESLPEVSG